MQSEHPRLLASSATWPEIQRKRQNDELLERFLQEARREAEVLLDEPPVVYQKQGRRLLSVSRTVLKRVLLWGLHAHLTGEEKFARRAEREMLVAAAFEDWNPSHFLDTAEMTAALAFGYDWLFDFLSEESRATIRAAIVAKGLKPGLDLDSPHRGWHNATNNWNSVCMGGLTLGALAIAEDEPELCEQMLALVREKNPLGLAVYAPDGVYPEGPMYWSYGTSYQVVLLAALESAHGTDFGLGQSAGFQESGAAYVQTIAPSGQPFNFSDCRETVGLEPALFWLARKLGQPELLNCQRPLLERFVRESGQSGGESGRFVPLLALWWPEELETSRRLPLHWHGRSENPLAVFRSSWDDGRAMYLALKGGSAALSHGHMDAGSWVFESDGVRWAKDLGLQEYYSLESKNIRMWDGRQEGERWSVFRFNNRSHNTLTLDDGLHRVEGHAEIIRFFDESDGAGAVVDLSPVFGEQVESATRGWVFRPGQHVLVRDELSGAKPGTDVRWAMSTEAEIVLDGSRAVLHRNGEQLQVALLSPADARFEIESADLSDDGFNAPNPGTRLLVCHAPVPSSGRLEIAVLLQPGAELSATEGLADVPLANWP